MRILQNAIRQRINFALLQAISTFKGFLYISSKNIYLTYIWPWMYCWVSTKSEKLTIAAYFGAHSWIHSLHYCSFCFWFPHHYFNMWRKTKAWQMCCAITVTELWLNSHCLAEEFSKRSILTDTAYWRAFALSRLTALDGKDCEVMDGVGLSVQRLGCADDST